MRIHVLFTGGTIGCRADENGILDLAAPQEDYFLLQSYRQRNPCAAKDIHFTSSEPLRILSENLCIADWNILLHTLQAMDFSAYDGIILTHGTDTLAFTAALTAVLLAGISIPVVFVGSNTPLTDENADGHLNFRDAVDFIRDAALPGVYVAFQSELYFASRVSQSRHISNRYGVAGDVPFGRMENGRFCPVTHPMNPSTTQLCLPGSEPLLCKVKELSGCVLLLRPYVGLDYRCVALHSGTKAVLHESYHSFTACTVGEAQGNSLPAFARQCKERGIPLYLAPSTGQAAYASVKQLGDCIPLPVMTAECAYAKLLVAYSLDMPQKKRTAFLKTECCFEGVV